jgi:GTP cyclohydrolase II
MTTKHKAIRQAKARIPTARGEFDLYLYSDKVGKEHLALVRGEISEQSGVLVRVHSECFTGDIIGSRRCDCGEQLELALDRISEEGQGILIYLRQEGRGIGLLDKLRAYNLQDQGYDTVDANLLLGHQADEREYSIAADILTDLGVKSIRLLTNNPLKIASLQQLGVILLERIPLETTIHADNSDYLLAKARKMNHLLHIPEGLSDHGNGSHPDVPIAG